MKESTKFLILPDRASRVRYLALPRDTRVLIFSGEKGQLIDYSQGYRGADLGPVVRYGINVSTRGTAEIDPDFSRRARLLLNAWGLPIDPSFYCYVTPMAANIGYQRESTVNPDQMNVRVLQMLHAFGVKVPSTDALPPVATRGIDGVKYGVLRKIAMFGT